MAQFKEIASVPYVFRNYLTFVIPANKAVFSTAEYKDFRRLLYFYGKKARMNGAKNPFVAYEVGSYTGLTFLSLSVRLQLSRDIVYDAFRDVYGKFVDLRYISFSGSLVLRLYADIDADAERDLLNGREVFSH